MILGFTTGKLFQVPFQEKLELFKELGCRAVELSVLDNSNQAGWSNVAGLTKEDLQSFDHVSLHAPALDFVYQNDEKTLQVLRKIQDLHATLNFALVVVHPDLVRDWAVFDGFDFPIAIENMDNRKVSFKDVGSLKTVDEYPLVLDMNHCCSNDPTLGLADELYQAFKPRIRQIHLSGYEHGHDPLFKTGQSNIVDAIPDKTLPIIIESLVENQDDIRREYQFVIECLEQKAG